MNRIEERLQALKKDNKKAFITYITAGFPDYNKTKELIEAQEKAGVDMIELGIPFSDPVADGPVIQQASYEAILGGANLAKTFDCMKEMREAKIQVPIVFMMYYNTVLHYGVEAFAAKCKECGVDGLIIPDLPFEEQEELQKALNGADETILIELVSPVSKDRVPKLLENARGFVYCVSAMGVTGQGGEFHKQVKEYLASVKKVSKIPVMMGFGIRTAKDVAPMKDLIDGAIVGTHFIELMRESNFNAKSASEYVSTFKKELNELD